MDIFKIAGKDLKRIAKNRFVIISVLAIIVVPMLYSLLYLDAFWDPYAKLEAVPIAVVNLDKGAILDGDSVNYGTKILDELKGNSDIGWRITDEKDALDGLNGKKYYAVVNIPEDFSKNIISAKEDTPKVANITFTCNEKRNFLAAQINSKVQSELKANITETISDNYVTVAFDSLYKAKDGMKTASDGSKRIKDGIDKLNDKVPTMSDGVNGIYNGSNTLTDAQRQLNVGLGTLSKGVGALNTGASSLNAGVSQLDNGISALNGKVPELTKGISSIATGSGKLFDSYNNKLLVGVKKVNDGLNTLNTSFDQGKDDINKLLIGTKTISEKSPELIKGANGIKLYSTPVNGEYSKVIAGSTKLNEGINKTIEETQFVSGEVKSIADSVNEMVKANPSIAADPNMQKIIGSLTKLDGKKADMEKGLTELSEGGNNLSSGINNFNEKALKPLISDTNKLANSTLEYATGANSAAQGTQMLIGKFGQAKGAVGMLSEGTNNLYNSMELSNKEGFGYGLATISQGTNMLNSKVPELSGGINQLAVGSSQLKNGTKTLADSLGQLAGGARNLQSGSSSILEGQVKLNEGITELHSGMPELTDGVPKLHDGSTELSNKLHDGVNEMNDGLVNSSDVMGGFVSKPMNLDIKPINPVPNYGTGFAPYFIPLSLWIGAIMMFFVIPTKVDKEDQEASNVSKALGKFIVFGLVGILQALLVSFIVLVILGLKPTNVAAFIGINIFLSLVFVGIVQCLILLLGDAGRLISIIFLILQLTGCAGTFPLEVVPKFFKIINPFMPFTYAVESLREVISSTVINYSVIGKDFGILALILVIFLIICTMFREKGEKLAEKITSTTR